MTLDAASRTLSPLPPVLAHGLIPLSTLGLLSFVFSTSLFIYLTFRLISWWRKSAVKTPLNQFLFLIYNLLLAGKRFLSTQSNLLKYNSQTSNKHSLSSSTSVF